MKYAIRLTEEQLKNDFLNDLSIKDENFILDPESNPVTVWIDTKLSKDELKKLTGVEDVVTSLDNGLGAWPDGRPVVSGMDALRFQQTQGGLLSYSPWSRR